MPANDLQLMSMDYGDGPEGVGLRLIFKDPLTRKHYGAVFLTDENNYIKLGQGDLVRADVLQDAFRLYTRSISHGKAWIESQRGKVIIP